ncbi:MAG TPA: hypothetical protein VGI34_10070 [Candidatus Acidoferrales bacterium]
MSSSKHIRRVAHEPPLGGKIKVRDMLNIKIAGVSRVKQPAQPARFRRIPYQ